MAGIKFVVNGHRSLRANADNVSKQDGSEGDYGVLAREMGARDAHSVGISCTRAPGRVGDVPRAAAVAAARHSERKKTEKLYI